MDASLHSRGRAAALRARPFARRTGSTMVELALVLPLLLMLFFAIAEFSLAFLDWQVVSSAAREGARAASLYRPSCSLSVRDAVDRAVDAVLAPSSLEGTTTLSGACIYPGDSRVGVSVPFSFRFLPGFVPGFEHSQIQLSATSVMANDPDIGR